MARRAIIRPEAIAKMATDPAYCAQKIRERIERINTLEEVRASVAPATWRRLKSPQEDNRLLLELAQALCRGEEVWLRRPAWRQFGEPTPLRMTIHTLDRLLTPRDNPRGTTQERIELLIEEFIYPYTEPQKNNLRIPVYLDTDARQRFVEAHAPKERENEPTPAHHSDYDFPDFGEFLHDLP